MAPPSIFATPMAVSVPDSPLPSSIHRSHSPDSVLPASSPLYRGVIFDLDGTLVDSTATLVGATNHALATLGFPTYSLEEIRPMLGGGTRKLVTRALTKALNGATPSDELVDEAAKHKLAYENTPAGQNAKVPFAHAHEMLRRLDAAGVQLGVLSNTAEGNVQKLVARHFGDIRWAHVAGARDDTPLKPNPFAALRIQRERMSDVEASEVVFVGDSEFDMKTGRAAGMTPLAVPWGIRDADLLVRHGALAVVGSMSDIAHFAIEGDAAKYSPDFQFV